MESAVHTASLFERLGGSTGIAAIVDSLVAAHLENPLIRARFLPYLDAPGRIDVIKGHVCTFLEAGSGGPRRYTGVGMRMAHRGMNISEAEFIAALDDLLAVLKKHGVEPGAQKDVLAIAYSLKDEIVHV